MSERATTQRPGITTLLEQIDRVHERTRRVVALVPPPDVEWGPREGWFTFGGLVRHLGAIERWMYAENAWGRPSRYAGHGPELAAGHPSLLAWYDATHAEARALFGALDDAMLDRRVTTPAGTPITAWKWLRAMLEHEAHHRGQLYLMLALRGVPTPPIFGLTSEEVAARAARDPQPGTEEAR
jgi:uncharacterized damage-inducible protein DinB